MSQSLASPAEAFLKGYDSSSATFELFVPPRSKKAPPAILFLSPSDEPSGWKAFEKLCKGKGILFAGPRGAGNDCPPRKRVRIALDVLDQVRKDHGIDPARTYIAGFSGGGRIACAIGFALPELFGGVMPICASGNLREEPWLREACLQRLRVALLTGEKDFNRGEVERLASTYFREVGARARTWTQPGLGHGIPGERVLTEALTWLEDGIKERPRAANRPDDRRDKQAADLLAEAVKLKEKKLYPALMRIKGVSERWPDTEAGKKARALLLEQEKSEDKSWEKEDLEEQRRFLAAQAKALDAYAMGELDPRYEKQREGMLRRAVEMYEALAADSPDKPAGKEAKKRIEAIKARLGGK
jgi:pimeloyl-ACP methyl ester carboxylesterase